MSHLDFWHSERANRFRSKVGCLRPSWPTLVLLVLSALVLSKALFVESRPGITGYNYVQWLFDYRWEFVKRGLPGEVLRQISVSRGPGTINIVAVAVAAVVTLALTLVFSSYPTRHGEEGGWLFALFAVASPATIAHLGFDAGRFDQLLILLALAALVAVVHGTRTTAFVVVLATTVLGVLCHELYAVAFLPMVLGLWLYVDHEDRRFNYSRAVLCLAFIGLTALTVSAGRLSSMDADQYLGMLQREHGWEILSRPGPEASVEVLFTGLSENITRAFDRLGSSRVLKHHLAFFAIMAPTFGVLFHVVQALDASARNKAARLRQAAALLAPLSPLALYVVGIDFFRWWSLALLNLCVVVALLMGEADRNEAVSQKLWNHRHLVYLAVVVGLVFGRLGIEYSFGVAEELWDALRTVTTWFGY